MSTYHQSLWQSLPEGLEPPDFQLRLRFLLHGVRPVEGREGAPPRVLDVGCGEGRFAVELAREGLEVVGVDVAEEAVSRARARAPQLDFRVIPLQGEWPLADASFDAVWAGETIEHVADTSRWLSQLARVLRPGGRLLLSTPDHGLFTRLAFAVSARRFAGHFDPRADHLRFYTARTLRVALADTDFDLIDVRMAGGLPGARRLLLASARRATD
jgi:2-polyprenyl-3-methyl-5-hydroxy-6-metoxy-1,4-benzoquinol methylase